MMRKAETELPKFIVCSYCERTRRVNADGKVRKHKSPAGGRCNGSGTNQGGHHISPINMDGLLGSIVPSKARTTNCEECGKDTSDDGECGICANCRVPLCIHGAPLKKRARYDLTCDLWGVPGEVEKLERYIAEHGLEASS